MAEIHKVEELLEKMSRGGFRLTDQRRSMAKLFVQAGGYLSPKAVYDALSREHPGLSFDTVYRNLRTMSEVGVLEQFYFAEGGLKFKASCRSQHHHHAICQQCEKIYTLEFCPMKFVGEPPEGFRVSGHRFEIYGVCKDCIVS